MGLGFVWGLLASTLIQQTDIQLTEPQENALSRFAEILHDKLERRSMLEGTNFRLLGPDVIVQPGNGSDDGYGGNPQDGASSGGSYTDIDTTGLDLPFASRKSGAAELIAMEALYQTLMYYGVVHIIEREGSKKTFKIIQSKNGYFKNLTTLDIAFAIRAFSMYLVALACNDPSLENFSKIMSQSKPEEIGLRFKYDMAWALLGNFLPRDANDIFRAGTKWKTLTQILSSTQSLRGMSTESASEFRSWVGMLGDSINLVVRLNRVMCLVNIRPDPREELKKRIVINGLLDIDKRLTERYGELKELVDQLNAVSRTELLTELKR